MWYSNPEKNIYFSTYHPPTLIHLSYLFTSASKPAALKFWPLSQPLSHLRFNLFVTIETFATFLDPIGNCFMQQTLPTLNRKHFFMNILCTKSFRTQKRTRERCSAVVHASSTVAVLTTETNLWTCMLVRCLDCHKAGLCCYLVRHI
jgi:hypothetical protein